MFFNGHMESQKEIIFFGVCIENNVIYAYFIVLYSKVS